MSELALKLIAENKITKDPFLDLGNCGLENYLPYELSDCVWIERINLGLFYYIEEDNPVHSNGTLSPNIFQGVELEALSLLPNLKSLDLDRIKIEDLTFLLSLKKLQSLNFTYESNKNYNFLKELPNLKYLYINSFNAIETLEISFLKNLAQLQLLLINNHHCLSYEPLAELTELKSLYLCRSYINDISFLNKLTKLRVLDLHYNDIKEINVVEGLVNLEKLHISCNQISDFHSIKNLKKLTSLSIGGNNSDDFDFIQKFTNLTSLNISSSTFKDYAILTKLPFLVSLNLFNSKIVDISFLKEIPKLQHLNISNNHISDISFLCYQTSLVTLNISSNPIAQISFLEKLHNLQKLEASSCKISDISPLRNLNKLISLHLTSNLISEVPPFGKRTNLQTISLQNNKITDIEPLLELLKEGFEVDLVKRHIGEFDKTIHLNDNPITNPSLEIAKQGRAKIIEYFEGKRKPLNECKLIFVGDGEVGKTSLMRRIVFNEFKNDETITHGINKIAWEEIENDKNEKVRVNLWDFGGQHIQYSLHQFFFTERIIYILVLNPRNDLKANYWLEQIEKLGCDSEILIVYNWKHKEDKQADFFSNFYELRKKYPKLREPFLLSCKTGEGVQPFKKELISSILRNEGLKKEYLVKWFNIKQRLEKRVSIGKNYITYETYQEWCDAEEYHDPEKQKSLLKILDSVGSIVFFDKPILEQLQVLNPEWLTTGAYSILVSEQNRVNKGHLSWDNLKEIFSEEKEIFSDKAIKIKYSENQFQFIIELMLQYNLCQRNPFSLNEFLIPSAFGEKPNKDYSFAKKDAQHYRLQFDSPFEMLIIHQFIAKNLIKIKDKDYWQSGIYIKHPNSETYALVETSLHSNLIDCWIKGDNIRGFWEIIRADFREILSIYHKFTYKEEILYKKDNVEVFLPYDEMLNALKRGKRIIDYHPTYCLENIDVLAVLDLFEDKNQTYRNMEQNNIPVIFNNSPTYNNNPHFEQKNVNTINQKINISELKELAEIKELLLDLEEYNIKNEDWKNALIKALDEFSKIELAEEKASQKTSVSIIDRTFKKLKDLKDVVAIGFLSVDIEKKLPELLEQWEVLKKILN